MDPKKNLDDELEEEEGEEEEEYQFLEINVNSKRRPECQSCGDPVKIVFHSGGQPMMAQHCKECYAELRYGKVPKFKRRRH
jgi:hypothetical protein